MKIMAAVAVCAAGVALLVLADWGLDPLTNFEYALSRKLHVSLGKASMLFEGLTFFLFFFSNRKLVKFGSYLFLGICVWFSVRECMICFSYGLPPFRKPFDHP